MMLLGTALLYGLLGLGVGVLLSRTGRRLAHTRSTASDVSAAFDVGVLAPWPAVAAGAGFAALWLVYGSATTTLVLSLYFSIFLLIFVLDLAYRWIPNVVLLPATALAIAISLLTGQPPITSALLGGLVGFVWFFIMAVAYRGAMGAGDVKLAGVIGLITGFPGVVAALTIGIIIGGVAAALLLISRRKTRKSYIPYGPFLVTGALITLTFGAQISSRFAYLSGW